MVPKIQKAIEDDRVCPGIAACGFGESESTLDGEFLLRWLEQQHPPVLGERVQSAVSHEDRAFDEIRV
jgi:hypothetical protein